MKIFTNLLSLVVGLLVAFSASAARFIITVAPDGALSYSPAALSIHVGDEVEFQGGSATHPTMSDSSPAAWETFTVASKVIPFNTVGTFPYHCTYHQGAGMIGTITVTAALATAAPVPTSGLNIFPNPSRGLVTVTFNERGLADYKLRLRNIIGQEVRTFALRPELMSAGLKLDLSDLPAGLYFYSLVVDNKAVLTKRLTLQ